MGSSKQTAKNYFHKAALVTGGAGGIGLAIARALAGAGIRTIIADIKEPPAPEEGFPEERIIYHSTDITDPLQVNRLYGFLNEKGLIPDLIICNAGRGITERLAEGDPEKWQSVLNLNVMGHLRTIRSFLPQMLEKNNSSDIVFISSVAARKPHEWGGIYAASKAALQAIAETLRLEVQPKIRVSTILPGMVDTGFFTNAIGGGQSAGDTGWGALQPSDIADAVLYIISRPENVAVNEITLRPAAQPF